MNETTYKNNTEWYKRAYDNLIKTRKIRGLNKKDQDCYTEKHHIIPKCIGGEDSEENCVLLTFKEHVIAHMLLSRINENELRLKSVVYLMIHSPKNIDNIKIHNLNWLEELRIAAVNSTIERNLKTVGENYPEERRKNISNSMKGKVISPETRRKQSLAQSQKVQTPDGIIYNTIRECAAAIGVTRHALYHWIREKPEKGYKYVSYMGPIKVIDPLGTVYKSIRSCALEYKLESKTIKNWIENYPQKGFKYYKENDSK